MTNAIDTNILLDILNPDKNHALTSKGLIEIYNEKSQLIISEAVFTELASLFPLEGKKVEQSAFF